MDFTKNFKKKIPLYCCCFFSTQLTEAAEAARGGSSAGVGAGGRRGAVPMGGAVRLSGLVPERKGGRKREPDALRTVKTVLKVKRHQLATSRVSTAPPQVNPRPLYLI